MLSKAPNRTTFETWLSEYRGLILGRSLTNFVRYIGKVLDARFASQEPASKSAPGEKKQRKRAILDLALEAYRSQQDGSENKKATTGIDQEFKKASIVQIRTFIFAGHDTTSTTICYALYMLEKHPEALKRLQKEHDEVLGPVDKTPQVIKDDPHIVNRLEYTLCVIRETLRLFPPASSTRTGEPGFLARDTKTGEALETEGLLVWVIHWAMQRNPETWGPSANEFDPARFMPENSASLPENAWRPFEKGPRNCIGQDLALLEARIILALVVRQFAFKPAYDSLDDLKNDGSFYNDEKWKKGKLDLDGEVAYPVLIGTAKPREGMPMRVKKIT